MGNSQSAAQELQGVCFGGLGVCPGWVYGGFQYSRCAKDSFCPGGPLWSGQWPCPGPDTCCSAYTVPAGQGRYQDDCKCVPRPDIPNCPKQYKRDDTSLDDICDGIDCPNDPNASETKCYSVETAPTCFSNCNAGYTFSIVSGLCESTLDLNPIAEMSKAYTLLDFGVEGNGTDPHPGNACQKHKCPCDKWSDSKCVVQKGKPICQITKCKGGKKMRSDKHGRKYCK